MNVFYFSLIILISLVWGIHFSVIKIATDIFPPLFYAALRLSVVAVFLLPFIKWHKGKMIKIAITAMCFGFLNYVCLFYGVKYATPSTAGVTVELCTPFSLILSVLILKESVGWRRWLGVFICFLGVIIIAYNGGELGLSVGVLIVAIGALFEAFGVIFVRTLREVKPLTLLFWFSFLGSICLWACSFIFEEIPVQAIKQHSYTLVWTIAYSALLGSILGHSIYYMLIQKLGIANVSPFLLMVSIFAAIFGVVIYGDPVTIYFVIGGLTTLIGVLFLLYRTRVKDNKTIHIQPSIDIVAPVKSVKNK